MPLPPLKECLSVGQSMRWAADGHARMLQLGMEHKLGLLRDTFGGREPQTLSTACSGIRAPELSHRMMGAALGINVRQLWAIENDSSCQAEILQDQCSSDESAHLVDDMAALFHEQGIKDMSPDEARDFILHAELKREVWCVKCQRVCTLQRAHLQVAGTPCVHDSRYGTRKRTGGEHSWVFWTFVRQRMVMKEPFWIAENVQEQGFTNIVIENHVMHFHFLLLRSNT